jgi:hypothetical protein
MYTEEEEQEEQEQEQEVEEQEKEKENSVLKGLTLQNSGDFSM